MLSPKSPISSIVRHLKPEWRVLRRANESDDASSPHVRVRGGPSGGGGGGGGGTRGDPSLRADEKRSLLLASEMDDLSVGM